MGNKIQRIYVGNKKVRPKWNPGAGLTAYYPFDSDRNDHKADLGYTGTTYNCTLINSPSYEYTTAKVGNGWYNKTYSRTGNKGLNTGITLGNVYTIMFWGSIEQDNTNRKCLGTNKSSDGGYGLSIQFSSYSGSSTQTRPSIKVRTTHFEPNMYFDNHTWHHFAIVQNGTSFKIYIDGVEYSYTADSNAGPNSLILGGNWWDFSSQAILDEVYIWNRAVTADEISEYYDFTS